MKLVREGSAKLKKKKWYYKKNVEINKKALNNFFIV
jgi:hypothetical protein